MLRIYNMKLDSYNYGFIGFGHMGEVIFQSMLKARLAPVSHIFFTRKDKKKKVETEHKYHIKGMHLSNMIKKCDVLFFCIKPQQVEGLFSEISEDIDLSNKLFISIVAGTKIAYFKEKLGDVSVIRVMPNMPSSIGEGMNIFSWDKGTSLDHTHIAHSLFSCMGKVSVQPESLMNTLTGICGSGPGFVYPLIQALALLAKEEGVDYKEALELVSQTFIGAAKLIQMGGDPDELLYQIAPSGGTTAKGLDIMRELQVPTHFKKAVKGAIERARELS